MRFSFFRNNWVWELASAKVGADMLISVVYSVSDFAGFFSRQEGDTNKEAANRGGLLDPS
jgi:hypothetical protein